MSRPPHPRPPSPQGPGEKKTIRELYAMSLRTTTALFGILILVLMVFGLMLAQQSTKLDPAFVIPTLAKEKKPSIGTVEVERDGKKYVFFNTDRGWRLRIAAHKEEVRAGGGEVEQVTRVG